MLASSGQRGRARLAAVGLVASALACLAGPGKALAQGASPLDPAAATRDSAPPGHCPYFNEEWERQRSPQPCVYRRGHRPVVALVGDSHALQWQPAFDALAERYGFQLIRVTRRGCPANWSKIWYRNNAGRLRQDWGCADWRERLYPRLIARHDPDVIFVATRSHDWRLVRDERVVSPGRAAHVRLWSSGWVRTLRTLRSRGARVVVSHVPPTIPFHVPRCLARHGIGSRACDARASADRRVRPYNRVIAGLPRRFPGVRALDPTPLICPGGLCPAVIDGLIVHRDDDHLTATYVRHLAGRLEALLAGAGVRLAG